MSSPTTREHEERQIRIRSAAGLWADRGQPMRRRCLNAPRLRGSDGSFWRGAGGGTSSNIRYSWCFPTPMFLAGSFPALISLVTVR